MPRRAIVLLILHLLIGVVLAAPAGAKAGGLERLVISGPAVDGAVEITADMLDDQLSPVEQTDLYWPSLMGKNKGNERPVGDLGPRYEITYILADVEGEPVEVQETVYLEADPPVAFAPRGQTHELYPGDVRPVPWGWRPVPERAVNALMHLIDGSDDTSSFEGDLVIGYTRSWGAKWGVVIATGFLLAAAAGWWLLLRRRRLRVAGG